MKFLFNTSPSRKDQIMALSVSLLLSFTILFFGPSYIFYTNILEMPFNFLQLFFYLVVLSSIVTCIIFIFLAIIPKAHFRILCCLFFAIGLAFWIQGQLLVWNYGPLDGREILWNNYLIFGIIDSIIWISLIVGSVIKKDLIYPYVSQISIFFLLIQAGGLIAVASTTQSEPTWNDYTFDSDGMFTLSTEKNVIIILLDNFQADMFEEIIHEDPSYKEMFDGFTFFPDTVGGYSTTTANIPLILTATYYNNSVPIMDFMENSYLSSSLLKSLKDEGYRVDVYDSNFLIYPSSNLESNIVSTSINSYELNVVYKLTFFRFTPQCIKPFFYNPQQMKVDDSIYNNDLEIYEQITNNTIFKESRPVFKFYHLRGAHPPFIINSMLMNEKLQFDREGYKEQAKASLKITAKLISKLKNAEKYNQSFIVVIGDHGWRGNTVNTSLIPSIDTVGQTSEYIVSNGIPLLLVKPNSTTDGKLQTSSVPATIADIPKTICDELNIPNTFGGYNIVNATNSVNRDRYFYSYTGLLDEHDPRFLPIMQQYVISNFSWSGNSWEPTNLYYTSKGIVFKRPPVINDTTTITFGKNGDSTDYLVTGGWSIPENEFTWTMGKTATISLEDDNVNKDILMNISFVPYIEDWIVPTQELDVFINGIKLKNYTFNQPRLQQVYVYIPQSLLLKNETQHITLYMPNATSPLDTGKSTDERQLGIAVYTITILKLNSSKAFFSGNWYGPENWSGISAWWLSDNGSISLYSVNSDKNATLQFSARSFLKPRILKIHDNNRIIYTAIVPSDNNTDITLPLNEGETNLSFYVLDGCERPININDLQSTDGRCLGIAVQNFFVISSKGNSTLLIELMEGS